MRLAPRRPFRYPVPVKILSLTLCSSVLLPALALAAPPRPADANAALGPRLDATHRSATFRVWAPGASEVELRGSFSGKRMHMERDSSDPDVWSYSVSSGVHPGDTYHFLVNGAQKRDPRARAVNPASNESVLSDPAAFKWGPEADAWKMPPPESLVMYEMHLYCFADGIPGSDPPFLRAEKRIPYLKALGVNAIQLMPVNEFPGERSWGYNPSDLFAVESSYGSPDDFRHFVRACHANGIAVLLDVVHNHYGPSDLSVFDWLSRGTPAPYFYTDDRSKTDWGPRPDFSNPAVRAFILDSIRMWVEEFRIDGFRWDSVYNIRYWNDGAHANPDGDRVLSDANAWLRKNAPSVLRIAEDHAFDGSGCGFQAQWNSAFQAKLSDILKPGPSVPDLDSLATDIKNLDWHWVNFAECHDSAGDLNDHHRLPAVIDPANPNSTRAKARSILANAFIMTLPGFPMFLQGLELHDTADFSDQSPISWQKAKSNASFLRAHADIIRLRRNLAGYTPGLLGSDIRILHSDRRAGVLAFMRREKGATRDKATVVVANFSSAPLRATRVRFPCSGSWVCHYNSNVTAYDPDFLGLGPVPPSGLALPPGQIVIPIDIGPDSIQVYSLARPPNATFSRVPAIADDSAEDDFFDGIEDNLDELDAPEPEVVQWIEQVIAPFPYAPVPVPDDWRSP